MIFNTFHEAEDYVSDMIHKFAYDVYYGDLIVLLRTRYYEKDKYSYSNELYTVDGNGTWICEHDWNEGQKDVTVVAIVPIDWIDVFPYVYDREAYNEYLRKQYNTQEMPLLYRMDNFTKAERQFYYILKKSIPESAITENLVRVGNEIFTHSYNLYISGESTMTEYDIKKKLTEKEYSLLMTAYQDIQSTFEWIKMVSKIEGKDELEEM